MHGSDEGFKPKHEKNKKLAPVVVEDLGSE